MITVGITHNPPVSLGRKDTGLHVPAEGNFYQILHDWQLAGSGGLPRQKQQPFDQVAVPSTRMMWYERLIPASGGFMPMSLDWQIWLLDLLDWASDDKLPRGEFEYFYTRKGDMQEGTITETTVRNPAAKVKYTDVGSWQISPG